MSSSVTEGSTWLSARCAAVGQVRARCGPAGSAARRSRRAASSRAGSRGCSRGSARTGSRVRWSRRCGRRLLSFSETTWPTSTPLMRTSDCSASASVRGNGDREAVALRLQRQRAAEGLPQEQQQPEAAEREQDDHEDVAERGGALLHLSPSLLRCARLGHVPARAAALGRTRCDCRGPENSAGRRGALGLSARARRRLSWFADAAALCIPASVGGFSRPTSRFTVGLTSGDAFEDRQHFAVEVERLRPSGPLASALLTTLLRSWLPQSRKNRKPALLRARVVGELVEEFVQHPEAAS